jgi:hypothetical protein
MSTNIIFAIFFATFLFNGINTGFAFCLRDYEKGHLLFEGLEG